MSVLIYERKDGGGFRKLNYWRTRAGVVCLPGFCLGNRIPHFSWKEHPTELLIVGNLATFQENMNREIPIDPRLLHIVSSQVLKQSFSVLITPVPSRSGAGVDVGNLVKGLLHLGNLALSIVENGGKFFPTTEFGNEQTIHHFFHTIKGVERHNWTFWEGSPFIVAGDVILGIWSVDAEHHILKRLAWVASGEAGIVGLGSEVHRFFRELCFCLLYFSVCVVWVVTAYARSLAVNGAKPLTARDCLIYSDNFIL